MDWKGTLLDRLERGQWSDSKITRMGGPATDTLRKMRRGEDVRRDSWDKLRDVLDALENEPEEYADAEDDRAMARVELAGVYGIERIVVEGPVGDPGLLAKLVAETIRGAREGTSVDGEG